MLHHLRPLFVISLEALVFDHTDLMLGVTDFDLLCHWVHWGKDVSEHCVGFFVGPQIIELLTQGHWRDISDWRTGQNGHHMAITHQLGPNPRIRRLLRPIELGFVGLLENWDNRGHVVTHSREGLTGRSGDRFSQGFRLQILSAEDVAETLPAADLVPRIAVVQLFELSNKAPDVVGWLGEVFLSQLKGFRLSRSKLLFVLLHSTTAIALFLLSCNFSENRSSLVM